MNIHSNNNNQSLITDKFPLNKVVTPICNTVTVNTTTNTDVGILTKINVNKPQKNKVNIPNDENMNLPSNNNNQYSVPDKFSLNKVAIPIINIVTVNATTNNDVGLSKKTNIDIPPIKQFKIPHDESKIVPSNNNYQQISH